MSNDKTGGQAFPVWELNGQGKAEMTDFGMTLRDYFAAKALPALIAEPCWCEGADPVFSRLGKDGKDEAEMFAKAAYRLADAMLEARKS